MDSPPTPKALVSSSSLSSLVGRRMTVKSIIQALPEGQDTINVKTLILMKHFPPSIIETIGKFHETGGFDANPTTTMRKYMDQVYVGWLRRGHASSFILKLCYALLFYFFTLQTEQSFIYCIIVCCVVTIVGAWQLFNTWKYWKKGIKQFRLWQYYFDLKTRSFCQLRGLLQMNLLGKLYDNEATGKFCGQNFNSNGDNFLSKPYILGALFVKLLHIALCWSLLLGYATVALDVDLMPIVVLLPVGLLPTTSWAFYSGIHEKTKTGQVMEVNNSTMYGLAMLFYICFYVVVSFASNWCGVVFCVLWLYITFYLFRWRGVLMETLLYLFLAIYYITGDEEVDYDFVFYVAGGFYAFSALIWDTYLHAFEHIGSPEPADLIHPGLVAASAV